MVKKSAKDNTGADAKPGERASGPELGGSVKESAQQIWLAGLGAFSKVQAEGGKVFEALVKQGQDLQRKTQSAAEERLGEASSRMSSLASDLSNKASGQWDKLEGIFEARVAKALHKLGTPSAQDIADLSAKLEALKAEMRTAPGTPAKTARRSTPAKRQTSAKPAPKTAAKAALKQAKRKSL